MNKIVINTFSKGAIVGTMLLGLVGCSRGPLHEVHDRNNHIVEEVDRFTKSELNNIDTEGLDLFKIDTIKISKEDLKEPLKFKTNIKNYAKVKNPLVLVKDQWEYGYAAGPRQTLRGFKTKPGIDYHRVKEYADKYIDSTIVAKAQNKVFANENESKFYVPVEYYGKLDSTVVEVKKSKAK